MLYAEDSHRDLTNLSDCPTPQEALIFRIFQLIKLVEQTRASEELAKIDTLNQIRNRLQGNKPITIQVLHRLKTIAVAVVHADLSWSKAVKLRCRKFNRLYRPNQFLTRCLVSTNLRSREEQTQSPANRLHLCQRRQF